MKISNIRTSRTEHTVSLLADCKIRPVGVDTIHFTFDKKYESWLYEDASPFAAALLIPAMMRGEDLVIEGSISRKLYEGMLHIMDLMTGWDIGMRQIKIKVGKITEDRVVPNKTKRVASFFSGGVDSFYTFLKHQTGATEEKITHFILINGNDIDLRNRELWDATRENTNIIAKKSGIETIEVDLNLNSLLEPMLNPNFTHGGCLAAVGLCLRSGLEKIYIPATYSYDQQVPYGSHAEMDSYWSSEAVTFEHDGAEASRAGKVAMISQHPIALQNLRVCFMNVKGKYNCGVCEKCTRTMIALYAAEKLGESETFPHEINLSRIPTYIINARFSGIGYRELLPILKEKNIGPELQSAIEQGLAVVKPGYGISKKEFVIKKIIALDHMYLRGKLYKVWLAVVHPY